MSRLPAFGAASKAPPVAGNVEDTEDTLFENYHGARYLNATALPEVSLMSAHDFSMAVFTAAGMGT